MWGSQSGFSFLLLTSTSLPTRLPDLTNLYQTLIPPYPTILVSANFAITLYSLSCIWLGSKPYLKARICKWFRFQSREKRTGIEFGRFRGSREALCTILDKYTVHKPGAEKDSGDMVSHMVVVFSVFIFLLAHSFK